MLGLLNMLFPVLVSGWCVYRATFCVGSLLGVGSEAVA